jgi:hypothetical protein
MKTNLVQTERLKKAWADVLNSEVTVEDLGYVWLYTVSEYCRLRLTKESDRMPALSGLASRMSGFVMGPYIAGIWEKDIARGLLFERGTLPKPNAQKQNPGLCSELKASRPSWSWATTFSDEFIPVSYDSILRYGFKEDSNFSVLYAWSSPASNNPFAWPLDTALEVRGRLVPTKLLVKSSPPAVFLVVNGVPLWPSTTRFVKDGHVPLGGVSEERLFCLLVGSGWKSESQALIYALVLRMCKDSKTDFERFGFLISEKTGLFSGARVKNCVLV